MTGKGIASKLARRRETRALAALDDVIQQNLSELAKLSPEHFRAIAPILAKARNETLKSVMAFRNKHDVTGLFTKQRWREFLLELEPVFEQVKKLNPALYESLQGGRTDARSMAMTHLRRQVEIVSPRFGGLIGGSPLPLTQAAAIAEGSTSTLKKYARTARRYARDVGQDIRSELAMGMLRKETIFEATNRLVAHGGPKGLVDMGGKMEYLPQGLFRTYRYWAQRIVRTEVITQYNAATSTELQALHNEDPAILSRWDAFLDRACAICTELDEKTVKPGEAFPGGYDHPPAHPNCRCALTAWREDWKA